MALDFEQLMGLWTRPVPEGEAGIESFARLYARRVKVNGVDLELAALVERARAVQQTYDGLEATLLARSDTATQTTFVFRLRGRQVGSMVTPLGTLPATGKVTERQVMDLLRLQDGHIVEVWMVSDELSALVGLGALRLATSAA